MTTDTATQIRAIRRAIKSLEYEYIQVQRKADTTATKVEVIIDIDQDIAALNDAILTICASDTFKYAFSSFLNQ